MNIGDDRLRRTWKTIGADLEVLEAEFEQRIGEIVGGCAMYNFDVGFEQW